MDHRARRQTPPSYPSPWPRRADHINASRLCKRPCPAFPARPWCSGKAAESQAFGCAGRALEEAAARQQAQQEEQQEEGEVRPGGASNAPCPTGERRTKEGRVGQEGGRTSEYRVLRYP